MADVKKTVEIALNIVGADSKNLKNIVSSFEAIQKTVDSATSSIQKFQKALDTIKVPGSFNNIVDSLKQLSTIKVPNLSNIATGFEKLGKIETPPDLSKFVRELEKFAGIKLPGVSNLVNGFQKLTTLDVNAVVSSIRSLNTALAELDKKGGISAFKKFASDVSTMKTAFSSAEQSMRSMNTSLQESGTVAQTSGFQFRSFAEKVKTVLQFRIISAAIINLKAAIGSGITAIIEYDQALKDLQAITGATSLEVAQMGVKILEVASTTKFSASEVAQGMRTIGQAGFSASEAVETMQAVSDLATGTLSDMKTTVDLVTTAMRVFRIDASRSAEVSDVFANAVNRSKLTIDKLRTAMNYVGPIARDSGVSFKELAASMGTLANAGLRSSQIGTGLRRVFAELLDPSKKLKEAIKGTGISLEDLDPRANSLSTVLSNLGIVVNDASIAFDLFGKRGASAVLSLTGAGSGFDSMLSTIGESGAAARQAATQMEGLGVSFKNMKDKAGILAIAIGNAGVSKAMRIFVDSSRAVIDTLTYMVDSAFGKVILSLGLVSTAVVSLSFAFSYLKSSAVFTGIVTGLQTVAKAAILAETSVAGLLLTMVFNPITLSILAVTAAVTGLVWWLDKVAKRTEEAVKLSDDYARLSKQVKDYSVEIIGLVAGSKELADANLVLRKQLLQTAESFDSVATEALAAALSIDPLTGKVDEGSTAFELYNQKLKEVSFQKLVAANDALNESFGKLKISGKQLGFLGLVAKGTGTHFEQARKRVAELEQQVVGLTSSEKKLISEFHGLEAQSAKNIVRMKELGKLNLNDTIKNFTRLAKESGASGEVLESMITQFKTMQETKAPTNLVEKWAKDGSYAIADLFDEYENISNKFGSGKGIFGEDAKGVSEKELIIKSIAAKKFLKMRLDALNAETAILNANGKDEEMVARRHNAILAQINKEAAALALADSENVSLQRLKILQKEKAETAKILAQNLKQNEDNALERVRIEDEANAAYAKSREKLREPGPVDFKAQESQHKSFLNDLKLNHEKHLNEIALAEAKGVLSTEQANSDKAAAELKYYDNREAEAKRFFALLGDVESGTMYDKRLAEKTKAEADSYKQRTDDLVKYNKVVTDAKKDLVDLDKDYEDEKSKHASSIIEIEKRSVDDLLDIDNDYFDKKEELDKKSAELTIKYQKSIIDNKRKNVKDEFDLVLNAEDAIRGIREKGMSDEAKQASQQAAAVKKLAEGKRLLNEYYLWGDQANLSNGKELLDQALGMTGAFTDQNKAIKLVQDATYSLKQVSGFEKDIADQKALTKLKEEEAKVEAKRIEAKKEYDEKYKNASEVINKIIVKENERHTKEMSNQLAELGIYKEKVKEAQKLIRLAGGTVASLPSSNLLQNENKEISALEKKIGLLNTVKKEKTAIAQIDTVTMTEDSDGVKSYTNKLKDASSELNEVKRTGINTFESIDSAIDKSDNVLKNVGDDGISAFKSIGEAATTTFNDISKGAATNDNAFEDIKKSAGDAVLSMDDLYTGIADVKKETEEGTTLTPYQKLNAEVKQLTESMKELVSINKIFDIVAKVVGLSDVDDLLKSIDKLKDKTITITTKYVTKGSAYVGSKALSLAGGGRIPGFGGGDRNQALLEDGEWIINKYAVRKFGDQFMESINNMTLPRYNTGGKVGASLSAATTGRSSILDSLSNFGTISLDTGTSQIPAMVHQNVVSELTSHLNRLKRFRA